MPRSRRVWGSRESGNGLRCCRRCPPASGSGGSGGSDASPMARLDISNLDLASQAPTASLINHHRWSPVRWSLSLCLASSCQMTGRHTLARPPLLSLAH
jgi:hypothetical protein